MMLRCPRCGSALVSGQGERLCALACGWRDPQADHVPVHETWPREGKEPPQMKQYRKLRKMGDAA